MSEVARQKPRRATRGSRTGWAWLNVKIPWQLKRQLAEAAAEAGGSITTEVAARLTASFQSDEMNDAAN